MPLPKRSKLISKRFKKPISINPAITPPSSSKVPWPAPSATAHLPCRREWRIRVICTDPDATDDSSSDEAEYPPLLSPSPSPSIARKRLIHEICLPFPSAAPPSPATPSALKRRFRPSRSLCRDFSNPPPQPSSPNVAAGVCFSSSLCPPSPSPPPPSECRVTEEEFRRFLCEFLPEQDDGCGWDCDLGRSGLPGDSSLAEVLDLELDSEALSWINSMQR